MNQDKNTTKKEFFVGSAVAAVFFLLWNCSLEFYNFTWQELVISILFGGYTILAHRLMRHGSIFLAIAYIMLIAPCILGTLWLMFCYAMSHQY